MLRIENNLAESDHRVTPSLKDNFCRHCRVRMALLCRGSLSAKLFSILSMTDCREDDLSFLHSKEHGLRPEETCLRGFQTSKIKTTCSLHSFLPKLAM